MLIRPIITKNGKLTQKNNPAASQSRLERTQAGHFCRVDKKERHAK
jgi:hypothetical protein